MQKTVPTLPISEGVAMAEHAAHVPNPFGCRILLMLYGVDSVVLEDHVYLREMLRHALEKEDFDIRKADEVDFKPGYTVFFPLPNDPHFVLGESHAALHTYPQFRSLQLEISSCRNQKSGMQATLAFLDVIPHEARYICDDPIPLASPPE